MKRKASKREQGGLFGRMNNWMNNLKLRTKMTVMFLFCVILPVIVTNVLFIGMMYNIEQNRLNMQFDDVCANINRQLDSFSQSLATMTATFYTNSKVYAFLDTRYNDPLEYNNSYYEGIEPLSVVYGNNTYINKIILYADNETLLDTGGVGRISAVKGTEWYKKYKESEKQSAVCAYYDPGRSISDKRVISFIRKLDFAKSSSYRQERLIKLDVSYGYSGRMLIQQNSAVDVYICDGDTILFSNKDKSSGMSPFMSLSDIDVSEAVRSFTYSLFDSEWQIYVLRSAEGKELSIAAVADENWPILLLLILIDFFIPLIAISIITYSITGRLKVLASHLGMVKDEQFREITTPKGGDELGSLINDYNLMTRKIRDLIEVVFKERLRVQENELQKQRAELQALHSQINPHFMFNALESIRMRSLIKKEYETAEVIELLAIMMRKSTDWGDDLVSVANEAAFAETYLKLQQYRFGDRLSYRLEIMPDCERYCIPKLSIVTFVENACVHGIEPVKHKCFIIISVEMDKDMLHVSIEDTGAGMDEEQCENILREMREATFEDLHTSKSVGIINACLRLRKCFGSGVTFELESEKDAGSCFTINIPIDSLSRE